MNPENISINVTKFPNKKPDFNNLEFGRYFTDHMFTMDCLDGVWHNPRIEPLEFIKLHPSAMVLHYGQAVFEGLKAFKTENNDILIFRPEENMRRLNISNQRMCIPEIDVQFVLEAIKILVNIDKEWIPSIKGTSLYIRPLIIATDSYLGVCPSSSYKFMIIMSPVGACYKQGFNPIDIHVETEYVRAVKGGTGNIKVPGNYAAGLKAQFLAAQKGFSQVLWLDAIEKKYIEEVGTMNVFFKIKNQIITPLLEGSILPGITRDCCIKILRYWGIDVVERKVSIDELYSNAQEGFLKEIFGTGTAAVVAPIGKLIWNDNIILVNEGKTGEIATKLYEEITNIQIGKSKDFLGWTVKL